MSDRQRQILEFISRYLQEHDRPPTNREIGQAMGIASTGHVDYHLSVLTKKGYIERERFDEAKVIGRTLDLMGL